MAKGKTESIRSLVNRTGGPTRPGKNLCGKTTVNTSVGSPCGILPPKTSETTDGVYGPAGDELGVEEYKSGPEVDQTSEVVEDGMTTKKAMRERRRTAVSRHQERPAAFEGNNPRFASLSTPHRQMARTLQTYVLIQKSQWGT